MAFVTHTHTHHSSVSCVPESPTLLKFHIRAYIGWCCTHQEAQKRVFCRQMEGKGKQTHTHTGTHTFDFNIWLCLVRLCPPQVMLVGDSGVGKTCLLVRFKDGAFLAGSFISTVGIDFRVSTRKPRVQNQAVTRWDVLILTAPVAIVCDQFINNKSIKCTYNDQRLDLQSTFSL